MSINAPPQPFRWDGDAMVPLRPRAADRQYVIGQVYTLEEREDRSPAGHRAYFAAVNEIWRSLPDGVAEQFPTADALRKTALIATGWRDTVTEVCATNAEARRWAERIRQFVAPDTYPLITVSGCTVVVMTARSQAVRAMNRADFQASSQAVLKYLAEALGVDVSSVPDHEAA